MISPLRTKWIALLMFANRHELISFKTQDIYSSQLFYTVADAMAEAGWLECVSEDGDGCIRRKRYRITFEGALIAGAFEGKI